MLSGSNDSSSSGGAAGGGTPPKPNLHNIGDKLSPPQEDAPRRRSRSPTPGRGTSPGHGRRVLAAFRGEDRNATLTAHQSAERRREKRAIERSVWEKGKKDLEDKVRALNLEMAAVEAASAEAGAAADLVELGRLQRTYTELEAKLETYDQQIDLYVERLANNPLL